MGEMFGFFGLPYFFYQYRVGEMARQGAISVEELIRKKMNRIRRWKLTALGKKQHPHSFQFTVMTYNILSQTAVDCHMYLYRKCNPQYMSEEYRISRILPEILRSPSDVVCLQEVEQHLFDQRIRGVVDSNGFGSLFKRRSGGKTDGCAILWKRAKFSLVSHREVEFRRATSESAVLDRDNVGLIAVLRPRHPRASQTRLHVATTHLLFNPRRGDVKLCQLRLLLAELERSAIKGFGQYGREYHPTVLCGDFNFEPYSPLYQFVESGRLDLDGMLAGNMSGQHEGRGKGGVMDGRRLSLDGMGIDGSGRFSENPEATAGSSSKGTTGGETSRNWYRTLDNVMNSKRTEDSDSRSSGESSHDSPRVMNSCRKGVSEDGSSDSSDGGTSQLFFHDFNFVPAYKYHQGLSRLPISSMTGNDCNTVDHIFYTVRRKTSPASYEEGSLKLLGVYTLPHADDLRDLESLPNAHLGSDHLSLMSKFIIL